MNRILCSVLLCFSLNTMAAQNSFWRTHTLVLIYASTCPHCHHQGEVLAPLVRKEPIAYELFSIDNQPLPQFSQFRSVPEGLLQAAYPDGKVSYPALFIVSNQSLKLYPLSYGFVDAYELNMRLEGLLNKITHYEANIYES